MRVLHCPKDEDPLTYARRATGRRGNGLGGLLRGNGLLVALVLAMIVGTFTIGPLRPQRDDPAPALPVQVVDVETLPAPARSYVEPVMCNLPAGGRIQAGWSALVEDGRGELITVRCEDDGTLKEIETTG